MVRHFKSLHKAKKHRKERRISSLGIYKKTKGMRNRFAKPYVVCTYFEWMNLE